MEIMDSDGKVLLQVDDNDRDFSDKNLQGANLAGLDLEGVSLDDADLRGANFSDANLYWARMFRANAEGASFLRAKCNGANLEGGVFRNADMRNADLSSDNVGGSTNLKNADLRGADLCGANLHGADLTGADLHGAYYDQQTVFPAGFEPKEKGLLPQIKMTGTLGVFAERRLRLRTENQIKNLVVQLGPVRRKDDASVCQYQLIGFDSPIVREIWGLDDIQAVQLALAAAGSELNRLGGDGKYSVEGDADAEVGHGLQTLS